MTVTYVKGDYKQITILVLFPGDSIATAMCFSVNHLPFPGDIISHPDSGLEVRLLHQVHRYIVKGSKTPRFIPTWMTENA